PLGCGGPPGAVVAPRGVPGGLPGPVPRLAIGPRGLYHGCRARRRAREPFRSRIPSSSATRGHPGSPCGATTRTAGRREGHGCVLRNDRTRRACHEAGEPAPTIGGVPCGDDL